MKYKNLILMFLWWCLFVVSFVKCSDSELEFTTSTCELMEPIYNYTFNFDPLHSDLAHKVQSDKNDIFEFNICGNLTKECAGHTNVAACLTRNGKQYVLGINQRLVYKNGRMYFTFLNGQECKSGKKYTLNVFISCDYTLDTKIFYVMPYANEECTFYILWETPYACLPEPSNTKSNSCLIEDKKNNYTYNFLPLSESNYRAIDHNGSFFIINVCKPVLYGQNSMCPPGSSVCFVNNTEKNERKKFINYGTVNSYPIIENGKLLMRHESDTKCNSTHNITSTIYFSCDTQVKYGEPEFIRNIGCEYKFKWETSIACKKVKPCAITNPHTGFEYDFSSLSNKTFSITSKDGKQYSFGICSDLGNSCLENSGICEHKNSQSISLGIANSELHFNETGAPYLIYNFGATCQDNNKQKWSTKIEFLCNNNNVNENNTSIITTIQGKNNEIKIIENSKCKILIQFQTELACHEQISCKAKGDRYYNGNENNNGDDNSEIDLTPLISYRKNYVAVVNDSLKMDNKKSIKFFLNVCRPLIPEYGLGCSGGSAACKAVINASSTPEEEQSLGYPDISLTTIDKSRAVLKYLRGDTCSKNPKLQLSSSIEFYCDHYAGKGTPILQSIADECQYKFYWPTSVICSSHLCKFNANNCEIINEQLNEIYNLRMTNFMSNGKLTIKEGLKVIDVCHEVIESSVITDYAHRMVKMFFNTNNPCLNDGTINVELRLVCSVTEHYSSSNDDALCSFIIIQQTPDICKFLGIKNITNEEEQDGSDDFGNEIVAPTPQSTKPITHQPTIATTTTTIVKENVIKDNNNNHQQQQKQNDDNKNNNSKNNPNDKEKSSIIVSGIILSSLTILLMACYWLLRSETRRKKLKRFFRKDTPRVQYSRVETNEEASVLLLQEGHITDSDEEMLT